MKKRITIDIQGDSIVDDLIEYERILDYIEKTKKVILITKREKKYEI